MQYLLHAVMYPDGPPDNTVSVSVPALPGCYTFGKNAESALAAAQDAAAMWLADAEDKGEEFPIIQHFPIGMSATIAVDTDAWRAKQKEGNTYEF
jgi:predicted RNase H-like HicB family nuclease